MNNEYAVFPVSPMNGLFETILQVKLSYWLPQETWTMNLQSQVLPTDTNE